MTILCIGVVSPVAWGRNNVEEENAQRRLILGDGGRDLILSGSPFSHSCTIGVPTVIDNSGSSTYYCRINMFVERGCVSLSLSFDHRG